MFNFPILHPTFYKVEMAAAIHLCQMDTIQVIRGVKFWLREGPREGCSIGGFHREGARRGAWAMGVTGQWWQEIRKAKLGSRDHWGDTWGTWHRLLKTMWRGVCGPPFCIPQCMSSLLSTDTTTVCSLLRCSAQGPQTPFSAKYNFIGSRWENICGI